jgi:dienelactone hydrolase
MPPTASSVIESRPSAPSLATEATRVEPAIRGQVTHGFLDGPRPIFGSYHAPTQPARNIAYVICQPLHFDLIQCYWSMRQLAEELAAAGFHVMRVHYDGTGESIGNDYDPGRVPAWLESVRRAAAALTALPNVDGIGLIGVRIGGTFAAQVSTEIDVAHLVLWEPSIGAHYTREMEILAASSPQRVGTQTTDAAGAGLVAGGYHLSQETLEALNALNPEKVQPRGRPDVLLVHRDDRNPGKRLKENFERVGCSTTLEQLPGHKEMMVLPQKSVVPTKILGRIREWALERSRAVASDPNAARPHVDLVGEAVAGSIRWRPVRFGPNGHLMGVMTEPTKPKDPTLPLVLLLTGGVVPRTSGNGSYVTLARRLAERGYTVLRMDVSYIGESSTADGSEGNPNDAYPPSLVEDARAGVDLIFASANRDQKVWLLGLCSGAYASFQTSLKNPRVQGAFLLNPLVFHMKDGDLGARAGQGEMAMNAVHQLKQVEHYRKSLFSAESWKKLFSGKANVRHIARFVSARVQTKVNATKEKVAARLGKGMKGLPGDFEKLLARDVRLKLVFAEGDPGHAGLITDLAGRLDELVAKGLEVKVFPGADHNFNEMSSRIELLDWVVDTICGKAGNGSRAH